MVTWSDDRLAEDARREVLEDILPFWRERAVDERRGGFVAQMSNDLQLDEDAPKGLILNARILWTFSAAYGFTKDDRDRSLALRAHDYLSEHFHDPEHGGYFWELDPEGQPLDDRKKVYGQAFCMYALAEHHRVFGAPRALEQAVEIFRLLDASCRDPEHGGYLESMSRDWRPLEDMRLSDKDMNEKKSMNNHLHVLEAHAGLLRVWRDELLADRLREVIEIFQRHILDSGKAHFQHFFDESWAPRSSGYTYGHDIEGSWLLCEAAETLGDRRLLDEVRSLAAGIARAVLREGLDADGGLSYEGRDGTVIDRSREWWPQAEAVVGFYNAWQITGETEFRDAAARCWQFIQERMVDRVHGEWFWRVLPDGTPDPTLPKVSAWKCPYHNGRACLEIIRRTQTRDTCSRKMT